MSANEFPAFARDHLTILNKKGALVPFELNRVQKAVHRRLEAQRRRTGRVRALVLKARQPGISTYVAGRFYRMVTAQPGSRACILTHLGDATASIFSMVSRFHDHSTAPDRPEAKKSNARELVFADLESGYRVGTAGTKTIGRGHTYRLFHGSEIAFWPSAEIHMAGILQTVPEADGTEIILESTANGPGGLFHDMCKAAERGEGAFELIFVPWFDHGEYSTRPPRGWEAPPGLEEYGRLHKLKRGQLYWAWNKNGALARACGAGADDICWLFRQEYPATAEEAFRGAAHDGLIRPDLVTEARRNSVADQAHMPLVLGVDIARGGADKTHIIDRQGRRAGGSINRVIDARDLMEVAGIAAREIDRLAPDMVFLDGTGIGAGVYDRLRERGYRNVRLINFGARPEDTRKYANKRAEMWGRLAEWLADAGGAQLPDDDLLHAQLCAPQYSFDSSSRLVLEAKEKIRARIGASPDGADALALTFAETIRRDANRPGLKSSADSDYAVLEP